MKTLRETGKPIMILLSPEDHLVIRQAAAAQGKPMTRFLADLGLKEARKILEKIRGK